MVTNLQIAFEKATNKYFDQNSSDEEGYLEYPELKSNVFKEKIKSKTEFLMKEKNDAEAEEDVGEDESEPLKATKKSNKKSKDNVKNLEKKKPACPSKTQKVIEVKQKLKVVEIARGTKRKRKEKDKCKDKRKKKMKLNSSLSNEEDELEKDYVDDAIMCESPLPNNKSTSFHESSSESEVFEDSDLEDDKKKPPNKTIKKSRTTPLESPLADNYKKQKEKTKRLSLATAPTMLVKRSKKLKDDDAGKDLDSNLAAKQKKVEKPEKTKPGMKSRKCQIKKDKHSKNIKSDHR